MPWSANANTASVTGTANLDELDTNTPSWCTRTQVGPVTIYAVDRQVQINSGATLWINPTIQMLVVTSTRRPNVIVRGTLTLAGVGTESSSHDRGAQGDGGIIYGAGTALVTGNNGEACCSSGSLRVYSGGTFRMENSTVVFRGCVRWDSGCNITINNGRMYFHSVTASNVRGGRIRIRCEEGGGVNINGLRTWNVQFDVLTNEAFGAFEGYDGRDVSIGVEASPNAANSAWAGSVVTLSGVPDYRDYASALLSNWRCAQDVRIINSAAGSATRIVPDRSPSTTSTTAPAHGGRIFHRVGIQALTAAGDGIEGARLYIADTDNGRRVNTVTADTTNNPIDESGGRTYSATSDADGNFAVQDVLTAQWYRTNVVGDIDTPDENEVVDVRGKTSTPGVDDFDIQLAGYGYRFTQLFDQVFNGTENYQRSVFLEPDSVVTEADTAVVEAYTTLETPHKWYDHVKYEATGTNYAGAQSIYCSRDGDTLNVGSTSLVLQVGDGVGDPTSVDQQGVVTVDVGTTFTGNLISTGVITISAGVEVVGSVRDANGLTVTITGLPAGHNAVAAAWPASQGVAERSNIVTGQVASETATSVTLSLIPGTQYFVVADAVSYRRSAAFTLDTNTQTSLEISLNRIQDASGNDLIPSADSLTDDEQRQIEHMSYWTEGDTFYYRTRLGSPGFTGQTSTVQGEEITALSLTMNNLIIAVESNAGFNGIAVDANRIYALYGRRVEGAGGTIFAINKSDGLVPNPNPLPTHITLPGLTQQGVGVDWPTDICVVPHENELVVLWRTGGLQRIPINAPGDPAPLGTPGTIHTASFPAHVFDNAGNMPSACHGLAMRNQNEAYIVFTNPHVIERVTWNTVTNRWEGDDAFPSSALSRQPVRAVAWDEVEDELVICDEDEDMLVLNPTNGRLKFGEGFDIVAGTEEAYITGMAAWGNELTTVWANTDNSVTFQANDLRIRTFGIRTGQLGDGAVLPVEFFTFRAVARYMEVIQSQEASQANPHVSIFSPGTIIFESGSNRKVAADQDSPREIVPDLSAFQITKIGADHQKEFVNYEEGPIVVFSGDPSFATLTVPPGLTVGLTSNAINEIQGSGTQIEAIRGIVTNISANTQPV